ncbi:MAG: Hemerythrin cation binding domain protein [Acidimicrobiia bacterium]|nr:Hemerythrin cation binding domain protein [Acidimicrobiia bacterium]
MTDPATLLKADHREVKELLSQLSDSDPGTKRKRLLAKLQTDLSLHMEVEELMVYPLVRERLGQEDEEEAEIEHGLAREGLAKLAELADAPGFGAAVAMLKAGIEHHVREEEKEVLPELKRQVERAEWLALADAIAKAKRDGAKRARAAKKAQPVPV